MPDLNKTLFVAAALLNERLEVLYDLRQIVYSSLFPVDLVLPGAPLFETFDIPARALPAADILHEYAEYLREGIVMPSFTAHIDEAITAAHADILALQGTDRPAAAKLAARLFDLWQIYERNLGLPSGRTLDANFSPQAARAGYIDNEKNLADAIRERTAQRLTNRVMPAVMPFPSRAAQTFTGRVIAAMTEDIGQSFAALGHWQTASRALGQRKNWLRQVKNGWEEPFRHDRDYGAAQPRRQFRPPSPSS